VDLCKDKKGKAVGKKALDKAKAFGRDAKKPNEAQLVSDLSKAESKYEKGFTRAEFTGAGDDRGCETTADACTLEAAVDDFVRDLLCEGGLGQQTVTIPSGAQAAETPGTLGVDNSTYAKLVTMFGGTSYDLNNATYTRYFCGDGSEVPGAILVLVPGFEGGASSFRILAESTIARARVRGLGLEVWAFDRRGHQIEDRAGLDIAEGAEDPLIALDWLYGGELGLTLHGSLSRRAEFHNTSTDTAFMANWTSLVFSRDIDAVIEQARTTAVNQNVFLGGHSAGTGFTARYAATDFNLTGIGSPDPGYAKVRGLVLLEGGGGSTANDGALTAAQLDRIEDRADGGLFYAVRDNAPRCVDGTACTVATEAADCAGKGKEKCIAPVMAYSVLAGLLNPRILASAEVVSIQGITDPDGGEAILGVDQGGVGNNAIAVVPDLATLAVLGDTTVTGGLGSFLDDDGFVSSFATFVRTSVGAPGPEVGGLETWLELGEACPMPSAVLPDNGPAPTALPAAVWGQEVEVARLDRMLPVFYEGETNFTDWYYPSAGLGTTAGINLDSTQLSVGRSRRDIENLTQAGNIDVPVICFGGSNGLTPVPASFLGFAQSLGTCTAPSCDGSTPRVVDALIPNPAFPTFGNAAGGYEVHISEGYAHVDIVAAEDGLHNRVIGPLVDFLMRNVQ
jgi:pimeloyl-ACP methyl ester carboxylesterase